MKKRINWGIIATGNIANTFAQDFKRVKSANLLAVGSRFIDKAKKFAEKYNISKFYGSYKELVDDSDVDAVYIATPHTLHKENTVMALNAGKHVLCEKPFAINAIEAEEMIRLAKSKNLFLMEAMWARFNPALLLLRDLMKNKVLGKIININADFGFKAQYNIKNRLFNPELGGGALLDIGVYTISFIYYILGYPDNIISSAMIGETGVDYQNAVVFEYANGVIAKISSTFLTELESRAFIGGTDGTVSFGKKWYRAKEITIDIYDKYYKHKRINKSKIGLFNETQHITDRILEGKTESEIMPLKHSFEIMKIMDQIRKQWGLKYPCEKNN